MKQPNKQLVIHVNSDRQSLKLIPSDDPNYLEWKSKARYRQLHPTDRAKVPSFEYIVRDGAWWNYIEKHGAIPRNLSDAPKWEELNDEEQADAIYKIAEGFMTQAKVIKHYQAPRNTVQRMVACWKQFGLLPYRKPEQAHQSTPR